MGKARHHEHPGQHDNGEVCAAQWQRDRDQAIKQDGESEFIGKTIVAPRLAPRCVTPDAGRPQQQEEGEPDLNENRQQDHLDRHGKSLPLTSPFRRVTLLRFDLEGILPGILQ
jgi:hypothetical protein